MCSVADVSPRPVSNDAAVFVTLVTMSKTTTPRRTLAQSPASIRDSRPTACWPSDGVIFDRTCTDCPRLARFCTRRARSIPTTTVRRCAPFGDPKARLIIVGLAPGFHGANATGRPFTGDHAGLLLYRTLHRFGFASRPESIARDDGLQLIDCRITNSVKCVPPQNKPTPAEIRTCNGI